MRNLKLLAGFWAHSIKFENIKELHCNYIIYIYIWWWWMILQKKIVWQDICKKLGFCSRENICISFKGSLILTVKYCYNKLFFTYLISRTFHNRSVPLFLRTIVFFHRAKWLLKTDQLLILLCAMCQEIHTFDIFFSELTKYLFVVKRKYLILLYNYTVLPLNFSNDRKPWSKQLITQIFMETFFFDL